MTILSVIRASKVGSLVQPKEGLSRRRKFHLVATVSIIVLLSVFVATFPIIALEDYFMENLYYHNNPLLVGAPNKREHLKIIESYFGRVHQEISKKLMPWASLRHLVKEIFVNSGVVGQNIDFYGSNGFCLFSYFVRGETSFKFFSISILVTNLLCVIIIGFCYSIITVAALRTSKSAATNAQSEKNNRRMQRKITIIILTDILTWLPFIIVCVINYTELVDTSSWYSVFCVIFLPINSIINPIGIYDETIFKWIKNLFLKLTARFRSAWESLKKLGNSVIPQPPLEIEMTGMKRQECHNDLGFSPLAPLALMAT
jgi:hypothetical protein